jgi:L-asparaginase
MNDEINATGEVTKTNTYRVESFRSPDFGFLGYGDDGSEIHRAGCDLTRPDSFCV